MLLLRVENIEEKQMRCGDKVSLEALWGVLEEISGGVSLVMKHPRDASLKKKNAAGNVDRQ